MTVYYVGVDGGGTSCRARIRDQQGRLIGEAKSGSANILLGEALAMESVIQAITKAAEQGQLSSRDFASMHVGLALAAAEHKPAWQCFMQLPHPFLSVTLNTDAYGACLGAHKGEDGAILIAGTGSVGLLVKSGQQQMVGGRGFPISDQGSGAMMGLRLIQRAVLARDGIGEDSDLIQHVLNHFNQDIDSIVEWAKTAKPCDFGQFSPQIFALASKNDPVAIALLKQTAADIELLMHGLNQRGANKICLMGGIAERIFDWLSAETQAWVVTPQCDAIEGALMFAGKPQHNLY